VSGLWRRAAQAVDDAAALLTGSTDPGEIARAGEAVASAVDCWARLVGRREYQRIDDPWLYGISRDDAEQAAATAGLQAITKHPGRGPLSSYVYATAKNAVIDLLRAAERLQPDPDIDAAIDASGPVGDVFQSGADAVVGTVLSRLEAAADNKAVRAMVAALDLAQRGDRITVAAIADAGELTIDEARRAWDRVRAVTANVVADGG
jgi:DNA-directed RNA polymerase specialized sigma24 family protein